jgi:peptide chain release factor 1
MDIVKQLKNIETRFQDIEQEMADPESVGDLQRLQKLAQERSGIEGLVSKFRRYETAEKSLVETREMIGAGVDDEMRALAKEEIEQLETRKAALLEEIRLDLIPKDPNDYKDIILEIRAGTGGNEAALFAADLYRMYTRYAQTRNWQVEVIDGNESDLGGFKEIIMEVRGRGAFSRFKYERGVHRVQRVPATESQGRIHTSTATVAVMPQVDEVEVDIGPEDLRIDVFHAGGAGGQNVNKVATAIRVTHIPTGIVTICQDERSQLRNKNKALSVLRARLYDMAQREQEDEMVRERRSQVGSGDRSEKIRTYNYPQDRITDHRINLTVRNLPRMMEGEIDEMVDALTTWDQARQLEHHNHDLSRAA